MRTIDRSIPTNLSTALARTDVRDVRLDKRMTLNRTRLDGKPAVHLYLHNTAVVTYTVDGVILRAGGWRTTTTKARINAALRDTGGRIVQIAHEWYLVDTATGTRTPFEEGMVLYLRDGRIWKVAV